MNRELPIKIGYVDFARLMKESPQAVATAEALKMEFVPIAADITEKTKQAGRSLQQAAGNLTEEQRRQLVTKVSAWVIGLWQKFGKQYGRQLRKRLKDGNVYVELNEALTEAAKRGEFDLVLSKGVAFAADPLDITDDVLGVLREKS